MGEIDELVILTKIFLSKMVEMKFIHCSEKKHQFELVFSKWLVQLMVFYFSHVNFDILNI